MSTFNTNILDSGNVAYGVGDTIYTAISTLSSSNFAVTPALSSTYTSDFDIGYDIDSTDYTTITTAMPTASATDQAVYSTSAFFLSSVAGLTHVNFVSAGTIDGLAVTALAFNKLADDLDVLDSTSTVLSAVDGIKFEVNDAYDGAEMAFILENRSAVPFTVDIAGGESAGQTLSATTTFVNFPELRRLHNLGYI